MIDKNGDLFMRAVDGNGENATTIVTAGE